MNSTQNYAEILDRRADTDATRVAIRCGERVWTYGELADQAARAGAFLEQIGVAPGMRVVLLLLDGPEFVAAFHGALRIGALPVPVNTLLAPAEYEYILSHSEAAAVVVSDSLVSAVRQVQPRCPGLRHVLVVGRVPAGAGLLDWNAGVAAVTRRCGLRPSTPDAPAFWLYSSGSSGFPKAVVHAQRSIGVTAELYGRRTLGLEPGDRCFSAAKLFHAYGLGNGMNFPIGVGAESILWPGPPLPEMLFELVEKHRPTVFFATPALYQGMLAAAAAGRARAFDSVRCCVSAGEALPAATFDRWKERFGLEILDGIGSTEMLHIFISSHPGRAKAGSTGTLVEGYRAQIVDEAGQPVAAGVIGDLWVGGDSATLGYYGNPEKTRQTLRDGWVVTGDKYLQDAEGCFWFQGRSDDMLKVNGLWVSPAELEAILQQHPLVQESGVVGVKDEDGLMQIKAFIVLREGARSGEDDVALTRTLQAFVKRQLPQRYPRHFEFVASLPRTATGKIKRYQLREREVRA